MTARHDLIIEIGSEELPAIGLEALAQAFAQGICTGLEKQSLEYASSHSFVTPRRLAVRVDGVMDGQSDRVELRRGPALDQAFDENGKPTRAATGFAASCQVSVDELVTIENDKGKWLAIRQTIPGRKTTELLQEIINHALSGLPVKKRMRWNCHAFEFIRPLQWLLVVYDGKPVDLEIMNLHGADVTRGHRFLAPAEIRIESAGRYQDLLREKGMVIADFAERKAKIMAQLQRLANEQHGRVLVNPALLDEVTGLVEWPVALAGQFNNEFLDLPREVLIATMEKHQKSFALEDDHGRLLPVFIAISNLESKSPQQVVKGNEKVLQPRLSDAAFFWKRDLSQSLDAHGRRLAAVMYQETLGSLADKTSRIGQLAGRIARQLALDPVPAERAGQLCKCDLVTDMVGEFPDLQGNMGKYYAQQDGEASQVAMAIEEHYLPRFAGDRLPENAHGQVLALADKLDTLCGIFSIGQVPTGDRDPFGLRRSALGVLRILIEKRLGLDLPECLEAAAGLYTHEFDKDQTIKQAFDFIMERLRRYYQDQGIETPVFDSVFEKLPGSPLDFDLRLRAVLEFRRMPEAVNLASANKRIGNILKQAAIHNTIPVDESLFTEPVEKALFKQAADMRDEVDQLVEKSNYTEALKLLSGLQSTIDSFFDNVLVMDEDDNVRNNRIALLKSVSDMFLGIADISRLSAAK